MTNDICDDAIALDTTIIRTYPGCSDMIWRTVQVDLQGATPQPNIELCPLNYVPAVWYRLEPTGEAVLAWITLTGPPESSPSLKMFRGTCDALAEVDICRIGGHGELSIIDIPLSSGAPYYIVVGDARGQADALELHYYRNILTNTCVDTHYVDPVYRSGGLPVDGPYLPGDTVGFRYVNTFLVSTGIQNCQWLQGVVPVFGDGWAAASFDSMGMPIHATLNDSVFPRANLHNAGEWDWYTDVTYHFDNCFFSVDDFDQNGTLDLCHRLYDIGCEGETITGGCCSSCWNTTQGTTLPPGWFTAGVDGMCADILGHPTGDWGDGNTCSGLTGPWHFYFELIVDENACGYDDPRAFSVNVQAFADGEVGAWNGGPSVCGQDKPAYFIGDVICCDTAQEVASVTGRLFRDNEPDCLDDSVEPGIAFAPIVIRNVSTGDSTVVLSGVHGGYSAEVDTGAHWIVPHTGQLEPVSCPDSTLVYLGSFCQRVTSDFSIDNEAFCFEEIKIRYGHSPYGSCRNIMLFIQIENTGFVDLDGFELEIDLDEHFSLTESDVPYQHIGANQYLLQMPSLPRGLTKWVRLYVDISCDAELGAEHCVTITPLTEYCGEADAAFTDCSPNVGPYDPNFKVDVADYSFDVTEISGEEPITYQIHFQNTGTAAAKHVTILDTLPVEVDPATFRYSNSSHLVDITLLENRILQFYFADINLPDSNANEPASHGLVEFEIEPQPGLTQGQFIRNRSGIYFDFAPPVITNTKEHLIACAHQIYVIADPVLCEDDSIVIGGIIFHKNNPTGLAVAENSEPEECDTLFDVHLGFYPTIAIDSVTVQPDNGTGNGAIYLGGEAGVYTYLWSNGSTQNDLENIPSGTYSVIITDANGCEETLTFEVPLNSAVTELGEEHIRIYPVPATQSVVVEVAQGMQLLSLELFTVDGQKIGTRSLHGENEISVRDLPPGIILMRLKTSTGVYLKRVVKM